MSFAELDREEGSIDELFQGNGLLVDIADMQRPAIVDALERSGGHVGRAALALGLPNRKSLRRLMRELDID